MSAYTKTAAADTTDRQIAMWATSHHYHDGAPPAVAEHALMHAEYIDHFGDGDETMLQQSVRQAREAGHDWMTRGMARAIAATARRLREERTTARWQRTLAEAGRIAKPHQAIVERVCELSRAAGEQPRQPAPPWAIDWLFYEDVLAEGCPHLDAATRKAINMVCVHRMTNGR